MVREFQSWWLCSVILLLACGSARGSFDERPKSGEGPSHTGGVLYLSVTGDLPQGSLVGDCFLFPRVTPAEAVVELPADGVPRVCVVYAAFAEGDSVDLTGVTFGIEYDPSFEIVGYGFCHGQGLLVPTPEWPKSGAGVGLTFGPHGSQNPLPVAWFVLSGVGDGEFRVTPHPLPWNGGRFSNSDPRPWLEPISGYGSLRLGAPGVAPAAGVPEVLGVCCLGECYKLTPAECALYGGLYLGEGSCSGEPCAEEGGALGACCHDLECELTTRRRCYQTGGDFGGEGSTCEGTPCGGDR